EQPQAEMDEVNVLVEGVLVQGHRPEAEAHRGEDAQGDDGGQGGEDAGHGCWPRRWRIQSRKSWMIRLLSASALERWMKTSKSAGVTRGNDWLVADSTNCPIAFRTWKVRTLPASRHTSGTCNAA